MDRHAAPVVLAVGDEIVVQRMRLVDVVIRDRFEENRKAKIKVANADRTHFRIRRRADVKRVHRFNIGEQVAGVVRAGLDLNVGGSGLEFEEDSVDKHGVGRFGIFGPAYSPIAANRSSTESMRS